MRSSISYGIDASSPGNGSSDGRKGNHNETHSNFDDEGRSNCHNIDLVPPTDPTKNSIFAD